MPRSRFPELDELAGSELAAARAWGLFLHRYPWQWYCHLTFRRRVSVDRALMTFRHWMHKLNRKQFGNRYVSRGHEGIRFVRGLEWQNRGAPHFHAMLIDCDRLAIEAAVAAWQQLAGDAMILKFDHSQGGAFYVAKVYGPYGRGDLDFGGEWSRCDSGKLSDIGRRAWQSHTPG